MSVGNAAAEDAAGGPLPQTVAGLIEKLAARVVVTPGIFMIEATACLGELAFGCQQLFALIVPGHRDAKFG